MNLVQSVQNWLNFRHVKIHAQARIQVNLSKGMPMSSGWEIQPAMEITFVKTLPFNHVNIALYNKLTFRSLTYHLFLTCRRKLLRSRLREANPIASNCTDQCAPAHQPCSLKELIYIQYQVLHRKTDLVIWMWLFLKLMCVTAHCQTYQALKVHTYSMTSSTLFIPNSRMGHSWG